jgi:hypothetical protein
MRKGWLCQLDDLRRRMPTGQQAAYRVRRWDNHTQRGALIGVCLVGVRRHSPGCGGLVGVVEGG